MTRTRTLENSYRNSDELGGVTVGWLRSHVSSGELDLPGVDSSSALGILLSTFSGSDVKSVLPSSERLNTDGAMALAGDRTSSTPSLTEPGDSDESLQPRTRSASGGQVRVEITPAIEVGWLSLGVGIANQGRRVDIGSRCALKEDDYQEGGGKKRKSEVGRKEDLVRGEDGPYEMGSCGRGGGPELFA